jgi:serine/threonine protein phosphatase PrpC
MTRYDYVQASIEHSQRCEDSLMVFPGEGQYAPVYAVIDGMGGHQHMNADGEIVTGREASQMALGVLIQDLQAFPMSVDASPGSEAEQQMIESVHRAHQFIFQDLNNGGSIKAGERVGAVLTVVMVCENGQRLLAIQVGDTRGYLYTEGDLIQLCPDEDNVEYLVRQGVISEDDGGKISSILNTYDGVNPPRTDGTVTINGATYELYLAWRWFMVGNTALNIPGANVVFNALGIFPDNPVTQVSRIEISRGDKLFLCSDGLYKNLTEAEIIEGLSMAGDGATRMGELAYARSQDTANRRRTPDDITALIVEF